MLGCDSDVGLGMLVVELGLPVLGFRLGAEP